MTVKEILEKYTEFGSKHIIDIIDYNTSTIIKKELLLEDYKKAFRKNARWIYREIKVLLDRDAVLVENNHDKLYKTYSIITRRSFEGCFGKPLKEYQKIIVE